MYIIHLYLNLCAVDLPPTSNLSFYQLPFNKNVFILPQPNSWKLQTLSLMMVKVIIEQIVSLLKSIHDCNCHEEINYSHIETKDKLNIFTHDGSAIVQDIFITNSQTIGLRVCSKLRSMQSYHMNNAVRLKRTSF